MDVKALLDIDMVALETGDEVTLMLDLTAPDAPTTTRPDACVVIVLDRSGSMDGDRLDAAKAGLHSIIDRMPVGDRLGLVAFNGSAELVLPAEPLTPSHRARARSVVGGLEAHGGTDLGAGLLRGLQEARRSATTTGATLIVLSDGHANAGITDHDQLAALAAGARPDNITTSTLGIGLDYDEALLGAVAHGGAGNNTFAAHSDGAAQAIGSEIDGLMSKTVQAVSAVIRPTSAVAAITVLSEVPSVGMAEGVSVDLGDMYSAEKRRLLLQLTLPGRSQLGLTTIAEIVLRYVSLPDLVQRTVTLPVSVNVVPGDEAAGRVPVPEVVHERLLLEVQKSKRTSEECMRAGDTDGARSALKEALGILDGAPIAGPEVDREREWIERTSTHLEEWDVQYTTKRLMSDRMKNASGRRSRAQGGEREIDSD